MVLDKLSIEGLAREREDRCDLEGGPWWMTSAPKTVDAGRPIVIEKSL